MRTIRITLDEITRKRLEIGYMGENEHTQVVIACGAVFAVYPNAVVTMTVDPPTGDVYPATVSVEDNCLIWEVTDGDLAHAGDGSFQLTFINDEEIIKTAIGSFSVKPSLVATGEMPDPVQNWIDNANAALANIPEEVKDAATEWLDENITNPDSPPLDRSLSSSSSAAPADLVGELKSEINDLGVKLDNTQEDADLFITDTNGNVLAVFKNGHFKVKEFDSSLIPTVQEFADIILQLEHDESYNPTTKSSTASGVDLDLVDSQGNVLVRFASGHIYTKNFDSSRTEQNAVKTVNNTYPDPVTGNVDVIAQLEPEELQEAVDTFLTEHPVVASAAGIVSVADYGAVGDGETDDSAAIQNAINSNYSIYFESNKTYYLASPVTIAGDRYLHGGVNSTIQTKIENDGLHDGFSISGTLKTTTTLTSDYVSYGSFELDNVSNQFTLEDMSDVEIGDIIVIRATDQFYSYSRRYYYLGATLMVTDIYDGHIYTNRNMPWDIELTNSVTVYVYSAPSVRIENLHFVSDLDVFGSEFYNSYSALVSMSFCKNSVISNCDFNHMKIGLKASYCVNTLMDNLLLSKSRYANTERLGDGYGIDIISCTNTTIQKIISMCAQGCIDLGGDIPCIDTYVSKCDVSSECRPIGIDMHDNSYNIVVEDCVLGGLSLFGTATINRCQLISSPRGGAYGSITFRGFADPRWSKLKITNCSFPVGEEPRLNLRAQTPQDYVQACDSIIDSIIIENCTGGGGITYNDSASEFVLSSMINKIVIKNWTNVYEIRHEGIGIIKYLELDDCCFTKNKYINMHQDAFDTTGIYHLVIKNTFPYKYLHIANDEDTNGGRFILPEGISIKVSSDDSSANYIVCGDNYASLDNTDYQVGNLSGSTGAALTRTPDATATGYLTSTNDGLVYTLPADYSTNKAIYPKCFMYNNTGRGQFIRAKATIKNTGGTSGNSFRLSIAIVDTKTGFITYKGDGTSAQATAEGVVLTHGHHINDGCIAIYYLQSYNTVAGSETTISNMYVTMTEYDMPVPSDTQYMAHKITGDGMLLSFGGTNNIMCSGKFDMQFTADYSKIV